MKKPGAGFVLEQGVLGTDGTATHPVAAIPRGFELAAAAQSGTRNLYLLRKTGKDSVMLLLTDSVGRTLQQPRQYMPQLGGDAKMLVPPSLFGLPNGRGFVLTYPSGKSGRPNLEVRALSPTLAPLWEQQLTPACLTTVEHIEASDTHLWLVLREYLALAMRPRVLSFRLTTGDAECNQPLASNDELDVAAVVPAGLLLLGTSDRRTSYTAPAEQGKASEYRRDFALLLSPVGQRQFGVGLAWPLSGRPAHYRWQSAGQLPDGSYQLIGETYRNIPNAITIVRGMIGIGIIGAGGTGIIPLSGYSNEQPVGLILAQLGNAGQLAGVHELAVPEIVNDAAPAPNLEGPLPSYPASFRFRGISADYQHVILNTSRQVLAYDIATQQLRPLTPARNAIPTVRCIEADRVSVSWSVKPAGARSEFEQIALP
ncbi:hypothetical protein [Hymenobacter siberiensis]|uniref:hypothetical protein n=1 Tax=Hymenobacter siberiensis TaxID=2848396 RepID=UPI001C1E0846|nr:hypothetical protein [Hymenobacter siberiensis]